MPKRKRKKQTAADMLAQIHGLTLADCLAFFDAKATPEEKEKAKLVMADNDGVERDNYIISEGDDNGCYVLVWCWASFAGTKFDKYPEEDA